MCVCVCLGVSLSHILHSEGTLSGRGISILLTDHVVVAQQVNFVALNCIHRLGPHFIVYIHIQ